MKEGERKSEDAPTQAYKLGKGKSVDGEKSKHCARGRKNDVDG